VAAAHDGAGKTRSTGPARFLPIGGTPTHQHPANKHRLFYHAARYDSHHASVHFGPLPDYHPIFVIWTTARRIAITSTFTTMGPTTTMVTASCG
jgi:hypothetical protein